MDFFFFFFSLVFLHFTGSDSCTYFKFWQDGGFFELPRNTSLTFDCMYTVSPPSMIRITGIVAFGNLSSGNAIQANPLACLFMGWDFTYGNGSIDRLVECCSPAFLYVLSMGVDQKARETFKRRRELTLCPHQEKN